MEDRNPRNLEVGKDYWIKYIAGDNSKWKHVRVTRFTEMGYPWIEGLNSRSYNGILSGELYEVKPYYELPDGEYKELFKSALRKLGNMNDAELMEFVHNITASAPILSIKEGEDCSRLQLYVKLKDNIPEEIFKKIPFQDNRSSLFNLGEKSVAAKDFKVRFEIIY